MRLQREYEPGKASARPAHALLGCASLGIRSHPKPPEEEGFIPLVAHLRGLNNNTDAQAPLRASQVVLVVKNPPAKAGDLGDAGSIPGLGRSA